MHLWLSLVLLVLSRLLNEKHKNILRALLDWSSPKRSCTRINLDSGDRRFRDHQHTGWGHCTNKPRMFATLQQAQPDGRKEFAKRQGLILLHSKLMFGDFGVWASIRGPPSAAPAPGHAPLEKDVAMKGSYSLATLAPGIENWTKQPRSIFQPFLSRLHISWLALVHCALSLWASGLRLLTMKGILPHLQMLKWECDGTLGMSPLVQAFHQFKTLQEHNIFTIKQLFTHLLLRCSVLYGRTFEFMHLRSMLPLGLSPNEAKGQHGIQYHSEAPIVHSLIIFPEQDLLLPLSMSLNLSNKNEQKHKAVEESMIRISKLISPECLRSYIVWSADLATEQKGVAKNILCKDLALLFGCLSLTIQYLSRNLRWKKDV